MYWPPCPGFESRESHDFFFFFFFEFFIHFLLFFFYVVFLSLLLQCKFDITVSTQFLLLYYLLCCPGLLRLQRFDFVYVGGGGEGEYIVDRIDVFTLSVKNCSGCFY